MELLTLDDWQPSRFAIVAQIDIDKEEVEQHGLMILPIEESEEGAFLRTSEGRLMALVRVFGDSAPGYSLLCAESDEEYWEEALNDFLSETGIDRSAVVWVPSSVKAHGRCES